MKILFKIALLSTIVFTFYKCKEVDKDKEGTINNDLSVNSYGQYVVVLGAAQDAGYPQIGCEKDCCLDFYNGKESKKYITSLAIVDKNTRKKYLFDATPDITNQMKLLEDKSFSGSGMPDGVFLTHAHIGHYTGLMYFGREAMGANRIPVYAMPKMKTFIENNGPWSQLVDINNIAMNLLKNDSTVVLNQNLKVTPFLVPHRGEFSETVGYRVEGKEKSILFIPDIDKWELWEQSIVEVVKMVDYAFLDATFFKNGEINRPMSEVPHPFIAETVKLFKNQPKSVKEKIYFIHFNHTNPALKESHPAKDSLRREGFNFAYQGLVLPL